MKVIVIIQARMGSKRFPGKCLYILNGKPVLEHVVDAVSQSFDKSSIYIATSSAPESAPISEFCRSNSLNVHSGDEERVASRFYNIVKDKDVDYFVRISGDSPLLDYRVIQKGLDVLNQEQKSPDLITTVSKRPYPSGTNVEIVKASTFIEAYPKFLTSDHFEHVTKYFYENASDFNVSYLEIDLKEVSSYKFSFDTAEDLQRIESIFDEMTEDHFTYSLQDKCAIHDKITLPIDE